MSQRLDGPALAEALRAMHAAVSAHEDELNRLNVFPVPDADTGTNMATTLAGIVDCLGEARSLAAVAAAVGEGALAAASGNSGLILGQALHGMCEAWSALDEVGPDDLRRGFRAASERADRSVLDPVEGTILTVARATADALDAAGAAGRSAGHAADLDVPALLALAAAAAGRAVVATTGQLAALRAAGVVDAAGRGYELCVRALGATVGAPLPPSPPIWVPATAATDGSADHAGPAYEVQYALEAPGLDTARLGAALGELGESVAIGGGGGRWSVHVHTDDAGAAVAAAREHGTPSRIRISPLTQPRPGRHPDRRPAPHSPGRD